MSRGVYMEMTRLAGPEIVVVVTALVVLGIDLFAGRGWSGTVRVRVCSMIGVAGCAVAVAWMFGFDYRGEVGPGMMVVDGVTRVVKVAILGMAGLAVLVGMGGREEGGGAPLGERALPPNALPGETDAARSASGPYLTSGEEIRSKSRIRIKSRSERVALMLLSAVGMMFLVSARDLVMVFLCLELSTVPLYVLAAFDRGRRESAECGLKYFLYGAVSTGLTLFGFSILYGLSGTSNLEELGRRLWSMGIEPLGIGGVVMVIGGMGFKIAAAPFHMWAPDVYEAAPVSAAAFIGSASKVAGAFALGVVLVMGLGRAGAGNGDMSMGWVMGLGMVAGFSMVLGNLAAIVQGNVRRLLAFSAVAHGGYMMLAVLSGNERGLGALVFYAVTYGLSTFGALAVAGAVQEENGSCRMKDFAGLGVRAPVVSMCMMVYMLSLAGIPPLAGFFGKFYVFATLLEPDPWSGWRIGLLFLGVGTSAVSLYYYLKVLKSIYVAGPTEPVMVLRISGVTEFVLVVVAAAVVGLGCFPEVLVKPLVRGMAGM